MECAVKVTAAFCKAVPGRAGFWVEHNLLLLKLAAVTSSWQVLRQRLPTWPDRATFHTGVPAPIPSVSTRHTPGTSLLPIRPGACMSCLHAGPLPMGRHAPCRLGDHEPPWRPAMPDGDGVFCHPAGTGAASDSAMEDHRYITSPMKRRDPGLPLVTCHGFSPPTLFHTGPRFTGVDPCDHRSDPARSGRPSLLVLRMA
jgi:hypothetical protein